jgi:large subunit ribosomal protein L4
MNAKLFGKDGSEKGVAALPDELFGQQVNEHLLWLSVKRHLGNQRQGTAKVKGRGEVSGGGRKPWRQKGTGRARSGVQHVSALAGWRSRFRPRAAGLQHRPAQAAAAAALTSALSLRAVENAVTVIEPLSARAPKTRESRGSALEARAHRQADAPGARQADEPVVKSCRNLRNLRTTLAHQVNAYELMHCEAWWSRRDGSSA